MRKRGKHTNSCRLSRCLHNVRVCFLCVFRFFAGNLLCHLNTHTHEKKKTIFVEYFSFIFIASHIPCYSGVVRDPVQLDLCYLSFLHLMVPRLLVFSLASSMPIFSQIENSSISLATDYSFSSQPVMRRIRLLSVMSNVSILLEPATGIFSPIVSDSPAVAKLSGLLLQRYLAISEARPNTRRMNVRKRSRWKGSAFFTPETEAVDIVGAARCTKIRAEIA